MPYLDAEAKVLSVYGQLHAAKGELEQARETYQAALAICEQLGEGLYRPHIERAGGSRPALTREVRSGSTNGGLMSCGT